MNDGNAGKPDLGRDQGASVTSVVASPPPNLKTNDTNVQADNHQIQKKEDKAQGSTMFSLANLTLGETKHSAKPHHGKNGRVSRRLQTKKRSRSSCSIDTTLSLPFERLMSGIPPPNSLLDVCTSRIDLWASSNMFFVLPRVGRCMERRASRFIPTNDDPRLYDGSLLIFLNKINMAREMSHTADVAQELDIYFPGLLTMQRFPTWTALEEDIIQVKIKKDSLIPARIRDNFQAFITRIASELQFQGISALTENLDSFWGGHGPENTCCPEFFLHCCARVIGRTPNISQ